jgi:hypothetical protein
VAQRDAGDVTSARHTVLQALEIAPNYSDALELLLELRTGGGREPARRTSGVAAGPVGNTGYHPSDLTDEGYRLAIDHVIHGLTH